VWLLTVRRPPSFTPFPYTTLFRSRHSPLARCGPPPRAALARVRTSRPRDGAASFGRAHARRVRPRCRQRSGGGRRYARATDAGRSEEHTSELQSRENLVCRLLLEK